MLKIVAILAMVVAVATPGQLRGDTIRVGLDATWPPMEYVDEQGNIVGFDVDLMNAVAEAGGFDVEFVDVAWEEIFTGLDSGRYDAIASAVSMTSERMDRMDFSLPYLNGGQVLVVSANRVSVSALDDLAGETIGVQYGTRGEIQVDKVSSVVKKQYDDISDAFRDLQRGDISGVVVDLPLAAQYAFLDPSFGGMFRMATQPLDEDWYGVVVRKGNTSVLDMVDNGLRAVMESGRLAQLYRQWFGAEPPAQ